MYAYVRFIEDGQRLILPVTSIKKFDQTKDFDPLQKYKMKWTDDMYYEGTIIFTSDSYQAAEERLGRKRAIIPNTVLPLKSCADETDDNLDNVKQESQPDVNEQKLAAMRKKLRNIASRDPKELGETNSDNGSDDTVAIKMEEKSPPKSLGKGVIPKKTIPAKRSVHSIKSKASSVSSNIPIKPSAMAKKRIEKQNAKIPGKKLPQRQPDSSLKQSASAEKEMGKEDATILQKQASQRKSEYVARELSAAYRTEEENAKICEKKLPQKQQDVSSKQSASAEIGKAKEDTTIFQQQSSQKESDVTTELSITAANGTRNGNVKIPENKLSQMRPDVTLEQRASAEKEIENKVATICDKKGLQKKNENSGSGMTSKRDKDFKELNLRVERLERQLKDKQLLIQQLTRLNIDLQKTVIDGFTTLKAAVGDLCALKAFGNQPDVDVGAELYPVGYQRQIDKMLHIGRNVWIPGTSWATILAKSKTPSLFVKYMAVAVFGTEVLKMSSVTGTACNRKKKEGLIAKPALDPCKLNAIRDIFRYWLTVEKKLDEVAVDIHLRDTGTFISRKIADLNRPKDDDVQPAVGDFLNVGVNNNEEEILDANVGIDDEPVEVDTDDNGHSPSLSLDNDEDYASE